MKNSKSTIKPELMQQWSERNYPLTPDDISYGSNKLVWWHGSCGHEWQASPKSRSAGENCPICSGARVVSGINDLKTLYPKLASEWSDKNHPLMPTMVSMGSHKKAIWQCSCGHEWSATVKSRVYGSGCPYCSHNLVMSGFNDLASCFPEIAAEWSERNYPLKPDMVTAFKNKKVWWKCSEGHEWNTLISTRSGGSNCPYCSGIKLLTGYNDLATRYPVLSEEWSDKNLPVIPTMVNEKSTKNVWWRCNTCGFEWQSVIRARVRGASCPVCAERTVLEGYNDLATTNPELVSEWDNSKNADLLPGKVSKSSLRSVWWKCSYGHSWKARIADRAINGEQCRKCNGEFHQVLSQLLVMLYARKEGLKVLVNSDKQIGLKLETYLPELYLAIESSIPTNQDGRDAAEIKKFICEKNHIDLVRIPYKQGMNEAECADKIKSSFRKHCCIIKSDSEQDVELLRTRFFQRNKQLGGNS
ncbi:zinc-ribbon domain-containing protein [Hespellia stercorisuis]|uniref:Probable Zinc-ribbon domain-containing protein n=1 Tax=Hespellia stercorisuis DSM 15480 TaxID=1121950 RepID=A0A1M6PRD7_9FIRM|nr:zinc-ribbon domain-containing protein [Hespellia stercorisuis]SHK10496.1 Probable Zinc-ribbon domain-containing protein [Hespellia stercorisuis DSM 15480]